MAHVKVSHEHPRLADVVARGLRSLDDWKGRDDKKTHFVLIDYSGVHYEIQTRQYDGTVGRASPVVRRDRTRDRDFVAKAAALLIKQDFGVVGTVQTDPEGPKNLVKIELRGGGLGDMSRWVKKDDVFVLVPPSGGSPSALRWSLLQVDEAPAEDKSDGACKCRFFHRYELLSIAGYRCIKLGTVRTPLRVRWIQKLPNGRVKPLDQRLMVDIRRFGFDGEDETKLQKSSDLINGVLDTVRDGKDGVFSNVAFVQVINGLGEKNKPMVPIALVDDQTILIEVTPTKDVDSLFTFRKDRWLSEIANSLRMQEHLFKRLETLGANSDKRGEIIQLAKTGRDRAQSDLAHLEKVQQELVEEARKNRRDLKLANADRLKQLKDYKVVLEKFIAQQEILDKTENDPQLKKWRSEMEGAGLLEKELDYDKAIAIYERIRNEGYKNADLDKHLAKLHKLWDPRNAEHEAARRFIYRLWPTLERTRLEENLPKARDALQKCKDAGDLISIQKLLKGTEGHADRLKKDLDGLDADSVVDDEKEAQQLKKISEQIVKLGEAIQDHLKVQSPDK
jgi:hypothetical protein